LDRIIFRYVERELYNYDAIKRQLAQTREEIIHHTPDRGSPTSGGSPGNPTETKAIKLAMSTSAAYAERTLDAIDTACRMMNQDQRTLYAEKYRKGKLWPQICREQYWSERKYHYVRNAVVRIAAECMGLAG
jgi:RinA family phage transcriptional activator